MGCPLGSVDELVHADHDPDVPGGIREDVAVVHDGLREHRRVQQDRAEERALKRGEVRVPGDDANLPARINVAGNGQNFIGQGAVVFIWSVRPYRTEWRYGEDSLKDILIGVGHICQNLYLACESIQVGTCAVVSYQQRLLDDFIGVDGDDEIALYLAPVGRV